MLCTLACIGPTYVMLFIAVTMLTFTKIENNTARRLYTISRRGFTNSSTTIHGQSRAYWVYRET